MKVIYKQIAVALFALSFLSLFTESCNKTSSGRTVTVASYTPKQGNPGTKVTITGSGFSPNAANDSVAVDGILATIVSASSGQIVFTVPADPSSLDSAFITVLIQGAIVPVGWFHYTSGGTGPGPANVSTFAGSGSAGSLDGSGTAASFDRPENGVFDNQGNLYVADYGNNEIRKITPAGLVTTFAGSVASGFVNGNGTAARFLSPAGIAIDNQGNLYVSDQGNNAIRKIDPSGNVTTVAGNGTGGYQNGTGTSATFNQPIGIGVDTLAGNLYVADSHNNLVRKIILSTAAVSTYAGSIAAGSTDADISSDPSKASFSGPRGITVRTVGQPGAYNLFILVADYYNNKIREVITNTNNATAVITLAGSANNSAGFSNGAPGSFNNPNSTALGFAKSGPWEFFIADAGNHAIRYSQADPTTVIAYDLPILTLAGTGTPGLVNGDYLASQFNYPDGVAYNPSDGNLYVMDFSNNVIRKIILQ